MTILHSARQNLAMHLVLRLTMASWLLIPCRLFADLSAQQPQALPPQETQQPATAQSPQPAQPVQAPGKIAVEVKTLSVLATVRDKHGKIIRNLNR